MEELKQEIQQLRDALGSAQAVLCPITGWIKKGDKARQRHVDATRSAGRRSE